MKEKKNSVITQKAGEEYKKKIYVSKLYTRKFNRKVVRLRASGSRPR